MWNVIWGFIQNNYEGIIALCALAIAVYEARMSRKHNVLTFTPHLEIKVSIIEIDDPSESKRVHFTFDIKNAGLGPAIINKSEIYFQTRLSENNFSLHSFDKLIELIKSDCGPLYIEMFYDFLYSDLVIPAGETLNVLKVTCLKYTKESKDELKYAFQNFEHFITYESLYEEEFQIE